jgi:serine/threonine-protein kinase RsbW
VGGAVSILIEDWKQQARPFDMTGNRVSYTLESTLESINRAEEIATQAATGAGFGEEDVAKIAMAVREATVNAVLHGNAYDARKKVRLSFENTGRSLAISVRDEGAGVDLAALPDPLAPNNLLKQSGRGIFIIRAFMDEVHFRTLNPGTEVLLIKNVGGGAADTKENSQ